MNSHHPFTIDAFVLLPEHLHCIWTLPPGDADYSMRWNAIKGHLSRNCLDKYKVPPSAAQKRKRAQTVWQPRFWEHQIRDDRDYEKHCDYIHWNPVKHGLVTRVCDWPYSSFHRFVRHGNIRQIGPGHQKTMPIFPIMNVGNNAHLLSRGRAHAFLARHFGVSIW